MACQQPYRVVNARARIPFGHGRRQAQGHLPQRLGNGHGQQQVADDIGLLCPEQPLRALAPQPVHQHAAAALYAVALVDLQQLGLGGEIGGEQAEHAHCLGRQHARGNHAQDLGQRWRHLCGRLRIGRQGRAETVGPAAHHQGHQILAVGGKAVERLLGQPRAPGHGFHGGGGIAFVEQEPGGGGQGGIVGLVLGPGRPPARPGGRRSDFGFHWISCRSVRCCAGSCLVVQHFVTRLGLSDCLETLFVSLI